MIKQLYKFGGLALLLSLLSLPASAQPSRFVAGTHYTELPQAVRTNDASKVEVLEVFWYGCGHCFRFQPIVDAWAEDIPDYVDYQRFPAIWNDLMAVHAQAYYTAENLGVVDSVHGPIFDAINVQRNRLQNERQLATLFAQHGVSEDDFSTAFNSFQVKTQVNQAQRKMQDYQIRSTPNVIVNGKYLIATNEAVQTQEQMLEVVDFLVAREQAAM